MPRCGEMQECEVVDDAWLRCPARGQAEDRLRFGGDQYPKGWDPRLAVRDALRVRCFHWLSRSIVRFSQIIGHIKSIYKNVR